MGMERCVGLWEAPRKAPGPRSQTDPLGLPHPTLSKSAHSSKLDTYALSRRSAYPVWPGPCDGAGCAHWACLPCSGVELGYEGEWRCGCGACGGDARVFGADEAMGKDAKRQRKVELKGYVEGWLGVKGAWFYPVWRGRDYGARRYEATYRTVRWSADG